MFNIRDLFNRNCDNKIVYENSVVRDEMVSYCFIFGFKNVEELLKIIGIDIDRKVYLYQDYSGSRNSVYYSVGIDRIDYNSYIRFNDKKFEIIISDRNICNGYKINLDVVGYRGDLSVIDRELVVSSDLVYSRKKIDDKITIYNKINENNRLYIMNNGLYELTLEIDTFASICDCEYDDLEMYLSSLEFPIEIDKVYSDICYILSLEQDIMDKFDLSVTKSVNKRKPDVLLDEIMIENGRLERITKTKDGKCVMLDKFGNFKYNDVDSESKYSYKFDNNNEDLSMLCDSVRVEVSNIKKLVRENFK